jgi:hypothetical protein
MLKQADTLTQLNTSLNNNTSSSIKTTPAAASKQHQQ